MTASSRLTELEQVNASLRANILRASQEMELSQQRVLELDRLATIGQLTAGILHEIRNPLNFVNNFARLSLGLASEAHSLIETLQTGKGTEDDWADLTDVMKMMETNLKQISENGMRAERIIQGMLSQTRSDSTVHFEPTNLNQMVEEFTKLAYQGVRGEDRNFQVSLKFTLDPAVGKVRIAPFEFNRVILNLVNNACYAVNEKQKKLGTESDYSPCIEITTTRTDAGVELKVWDNGSGIPDEIRSKLFDPFFTTKPVGKGTGLGLSLTLDIVRNLHGGTLTVHSEPGEFTEFLITLPQTSDTAAE